MWAAQADRILPGWKSQPGWPGPSFAGDAPGGPGGAGCHPGPGPYPYILHRAHEEALVTLQESEHVEELIVAAFTQRGIPIDEKSNKQYHKDLTTRKTRYQG
jgi:hypothetical protein